MTDNVSTIPAPGVVMRYAMWPGHYGDVVAELRWTTLSLGREGWTIVRWARVSLDGDVEQRRPPRYPAVDGHRCLEISPGLFESFWSAAS